MDEAILIYIAKRFRRLEDIIEAADVFHAERVDRAKERIEKADEDRKRHQDYPRFCRETNKAERERDSVQVVRDDLEKALEACRDDMVFLSEAARK